MHMVRAVKSMTPQLAVQGLAEGETLVAPGLRIGLGVGGVDAVHLGGLEQDVGVELGAAQSAAHVSVVKNGLPVPAARISMRPFSKCRRARRG